MTTRTLDLGCGRFVRNPYNAQEAFGIDIAPSDLPNVKRRDLVVEPIPYPAHFFNFVTAYDFLEHIPRTLHIEGKTVHPFINVMNEIWRVLTPGGIFRAHTPAYPKEEAFTDPTHVNIITMKTVNYFCGGQYENLSKSYGFDGMFELVSQGWDKTWDYHLVWVLKAVK